MEAYLEFEDDFIGMTIVDDDLEEFKRLLPSIIPHHLYYFSCCEHGRLEMLQLLPPQFLVLDDHSRNMLHYACEFGNDAIVSYLLQYEPMLATSQDNDGDLPFHLACANGHYPIVSFLLMNYPQVLHIDPNQNGTCLNAILDNPLNKQSFEIIQHMISNRPALLHIPRYSQYPLFQLFCIDHHDFHYCHLCLQLFLKFNCNVNTLDLNNKNILHYVIKLNNPEIVSEFINRGVDINHQDVDGNSPIADYYKASTNLSFVERYFQYIPTPIHWQLTNKHGESVEFLKNRAVSMNHTPGRKRGLMEDENHINKKMHFYSSCFVFCTNSNAFSLECRRYNS